MRAIKWNLNIDKLKICYNQPTELWQDLEKYNTNDFVNYDCFSLQIIDDGRGKEINDKPRTKIKARVLLDEGIELGSFTFNNSNKYCGKCFFEFTNKSFYTIAGYNFGKKYNHLISLDYVEQQLNLTKNNITCIEIACDVNFNVIHIIQQLIKNYKDYTLYINGNIMDDETRKIENYGEYFQRSRKKRERYPTIYLSQKKEDSPSIKIYDKLTEINEESGKNYITEWNEMPTQMYRLEITCKNEDFKKFMQLIGESNDNYNYIEGVCLHLSCEEYIHNLWKYICDRMLYFKHKETDEIITLSDICMQGYKPQKTKTSKVYNQHPFQIS